MKKIVLVLCAAFAVAAAVITASCMADTPEERAIHAAKRAAEERGIVTGDAEIIYDPVSKRWEERVAAIESLPQDPNHGKLPHGVLYNKKFETVLLDFKDDAKEADAWVFVNPDTGDVITVYQESR